MSSNFDRAAPPPANRRARMWQASVAEENGTEILFEGTAGQWAW